MIPVLARIQKSAAWHEERRKGIGGSEWTDILADQHPGEYKWSCMRKLYYTKKGAVPDFPEITTKAMMRGNILEPVVAELYLAHTGYKVTKKKPRAKMLYPGQKVPYWWIGNTDYIVVDLNGVLRVLECKTMNAHVWSEFIENGLSVGYKLQPQHYMGLTGLDIADVAVMWPDGMDFQEEPVPRDTDTLKLMVEAGDWFMNSVLKDSLLPQRPTVTEQRCAGCPYGRQCLGKAFFDPHDIGLKNLSSDEELYAKLAQFEAAKASKKASEEEMDAIKDAIQLYIADKHGDDVESFFCREVEVTCTKRINSRFQREDILADRPDLAPIIRQYTKFFPSQGLTSKVTKKSQERWARTG